MIDFRVHMIGTANQQDCLLPSFFDPGENLRPIIADILTILLDFLIGCHDGRRDFMFGNPFLAPQLLIKTRNQALLVMNRQKRLDKINILFAQDIHIAADIFGIRCDDRTVEMVVRRVDIILHIVRFTGIENLFYTFFDKVNNMTMRNLGRIAERIGGHGCHALIVHLRA